MADQISLAQEAIKKGERTRVLFEILLSELGMSFENTHREVWDKLKETQQEYEESIELMSTIIRENATRNNVGVS